MLYYGNFLYSEGFICGGKYFTEILIDKYNTISSCYKECYKNNKRIGMQEQIKYEMKYNIKDKQCMHFVNSKKYGFIKRERYDVTILYFYENDVQQGISIYNNNNHVRRITCHYKNNNININPSYICGNNHVTITSTKMKNISNEGYIVSSNGHDYNDIYIKKMLKDNICQPISIFKYNDNITIVIDDLQCSESITFHINKNNILKSFSYNKCKNFTTKKIISYARNDNNTISIYYNLISLI